MATNDYLDQIVCEDNVLFTSKLSDNSIDLIVTSPPYNSLRDYKGYCFDFDGLAKELYRVLKSGGVLVWVVGDSVEGGSETGTSFQQVLDFKNKYNFLLHDTMMYEKNSSSFPARREGNRYSQIFEYMFILSKGAPSKTNLISDKLNLWEGWVSFGQATMRAVDGSKIPLKKKEPTPKFSPRNNIWKYSTGKNYSTKDSIAFEHPAIFPEALAWDHVVTWTDEGDIVYDPFMGSGTVAKTALLTKRKYIGCDISKEYVDIAKQRVEDYKKQLSSYRFESIDRVFSFIEESGYKKIEEKVESDFFTLSLKNQEDKVLLLGLKGVLSYENRGYISIKKEDCSKFDYLIFILGDFKTESVFLIDGIKFQDMVSRKFYSFDKGGVYYFPSKIIEGYCARILRIKKKEI